MTTKAQELRGEKVVHCGKVLTLYLSWNGITEERCKKVKMYVRNPKQPLK